MFNNLKADADVKLREDSN